MATTSPQPLHDDLIVYEILTRLPAADAVRLRSVCRAWNAALTSDAFVAAHAAARRQPEILFFPPDGGAATSFYTCSLLPPATTATARKLVTLGGITGEYVVLSRTPCRGLTLVFEARKSEYYLCNLSTGDHVALPPCDAAAERSADRFHPLMAPWTPFENSSTGVGFDATTGEHKVVRLFMDESTKEVKCEVYTPGSRGWRPCAGHAPSTPIYLGGLPPVAVDGSFYWLPNPGIVAFDKRRPILSLSIDDEQFGWVHKPPGQEKRVRHLADLDGSLCAVAVHGQRRRWAGVGTTPRVIELLTWSRGTATSPSSWSMRCRISLDILPREMSDELDRERTIVPLCTAGGGKIVLLATGRHKVFAYDEEHKSMERVFSMYDYVDFPVCHSEARLFINIVLHDDRLVSVRRSSAAEDSDKRLQVKMGGGDTIRKQEKHRQERHTPEEDTIHSWWQTSWTQKRRDCLPSNAL